MHRRSVHARFVLCLAPAIALTLAGSVAAQPTIALTNPSGAFGGQAGHLAKTPLEGSTAVAVTGDLATIEVFADLRALGGPIRASFADQGLQCDDDTADGRFVPCFGVPLNAVPGAYPITVTVEDGNGRTASLTSTFTVGAAADGDGDGLPDAWETRYGLGDTSGDADLDGATNLAEFRAGTHPRGTVARFFAEAASNVFFGTKLDLFNPGGTPVELIIAMEASDGARTTQALTLPPNDGAHLDLRTWAPGSDYSIAIASDGFFIADRTVEWLRQRNPGQRGEVGTLPYGSHAETSIASPSGIWFLAEGATHGGFDLFYLLHNPNGAPAEVTIEYMRPAPLSSITRTYTVAPHARRTIYVDMEGPELAATDVSAAITASSSIVVERAMYYTAPGQTFTAGHAGAGATLPSTTWYLAEGAGGYFDTFILLMNPFASPATVTLSYFGPFGLSGARTYTLPARSRLTVNPHDGSTPGVPGAISTAISSTAPIVVERAMWWPSPRMGQGAWREAHVVAGALAGATRWALAGVRVRVDDDTIRWDEAIESYILIGNPAATSSTVTIRWGTASLALPLPAQSRVTMPASALYTALSGRPAGIADTRLNLVIESAGPPIVVERATYADAGSVQWASGSALAGTPLP